MTDENLLIQRLQADDESAFKELLDSFGPRILRAAKILTGNNSASEELTSDTLSDAYFAIKRFRGESGLFTWLYRILLNKYYSWLRQQKKAVSLDISLTFIEAPREDSNKETLDVFQNNLSGILDKISPEHKEVILLKYMEEMKIEDISEILKIPEGTVKTRLHHAINNMRKIMKEMNLLPGSVTY
jgi:RNA polymerase sigma-70 factor (ECF subfamily)